ncbi:hypothetical protein MTO96_014238 [Rhipicephalus appendiculatus]
MGIFVNLKKMKALKSVYVSGVVRKAELKLWLNYLCSSPLYKRYRISVPDGAIDQCLNDLANADEMETAEGLEEDAAAIDDPVCASRLLTLRQETVIWDDTASLYETHLDQIVAKKKQFEGNISGEDLEQMCRELLQQNVDELQQQEQTVEAAAKCPNGIRLFYSNADVDRYNAHCLADADDVLRHPACDKITGYKSELEYTDTLSKDGKDEYKRHGGACRPRFV